MLQSDQHEPDDELPITSLETLKVLSDPLRARIVDLLRAKAHTVKQLAAVLSIPPKKLYYHTHLLESHGLIRVVDTRIVSGIIEKRYRATAYVFLINPLFFSSTASGEEGVRAGLSFTFDATRNQLERSIQDQLVELSEEAPPTRRLLLKWKFGRLAPEQVEAFQARLNDLFEEFELMDQATESTATQTYRVMMVMFPIHGRSSSAKETGSTT